MNLILCKNINNHLISFNDDEVIATITSDNEYELMDVITQLNENGGIIYIDTPVINIIKSISISIKGDLPGGIIGIKQSNEEYPKINFIKEDEYSFFGIIILGSNKFIEYIIIENTEDFGVTVIGDNNILDHVISRYNQRGGFQIRGNYNTLKYCYAYRNGQFYHDSLPIGYHGFQILGEKNNVLNYCFAWDNVGSGFSYEGTFKPSDISYLHSGSWNNGNINVYTGKYDYDNGNPLDKNLWSIKQIMESNPNFASNYYNKKFNIDNAYIDGITVKEWIAKVSPSLEGYGFIFGISSISQTNDIKRKKNAFNCVAFDNLGGFIEFYNHKYSAEMNNCVSFNNGINYQLPYSFSEWTNNWGWGSKNKDQLNKVTTQIPSNMNTAQRSFYSVRDQIIKAVYANMFPENINFDKIIIGLKE